jgi:hypothetical protein
MPNISLGPSRKPIVHNLLSFLLITLADMHYLFP